MSITHGYSWLGFIFGPFLLILVVHFLVPLLFLIKGIPLAQQLDVAFTYDLQQSAGTFALALNSQVLSSLLQSYQNSLATVINQLVCVGSQFETMNLQSIPLINAYSLSQTASSNASSLNMSMWYAQGISQFSQLSSAQQQVYTAYQNAEPYIEAYFASSNNSPTAVVGLLSCLASAGSSGSQLAFNYPAQYQSYFSVANNTAWPACCTTTLQRFATNATSISVFTTPSSNLPLQQLLMLCTVLNGTLVYGVTCLQLSVRGLAGLMVASLNKLDQSFFKANYTVLTPAYDSQCSQAIFTVDSTLTNITLPTSQSCYAGQSNPSWSSLLVLRSGSGGSFGMAVTVSDYSGRQGVVGYAIVESQGVKWSENYSNDFASSYIISMVLIAVSLGVSLLVLQRLLNGLSVQLSRLNEKCKFIVDGDIEIDIPEFSGTEDIAEVYDEVRIINKLHRYSSEGYFVGHCSNKILKYTGALPLIKSLGYGTSALYENLGECYGSIEEFDQAIDYLELSVNECLAEIEKKFGGIDLVYSIKQSQEKKFSIAYKQIQTALIRKLWKLNFVFLKWLEIDVTNSKTVEDDEQDKCKKAKMRAKLNNYLELFKKALYPDFANCSESLLTLLFEAKSQITLGNSAFARSCLSRAEKLIKIYEQAYAETSRLLQTETKNRIFQQRNNMTAHSRSHPQLIRSFYNFVWGIWQLKCSRATDRYLDAYDHFVAAITNDKMTQSLQFLSVNEIKKTLKTLGISPVLFESTEVFRQSFPLRPLHFGKLSKEDEVELCKYPNRNTAGLEREFVLMVDCGKHAVGGAEQQFRGWQKSVQDRLKVVFEELIKPNDRVSIVKFNSQICLETVCNLTLKAENEVLLRKEIKNVTRLRNMAGRSEILFAFEKIIERLKTLRSEKIVVLFMKSIEIYQLSHRKAMGRVRQVEKEEDLQNRSKKQTVGSAISELSQNLIELSETGDKIIEIMTDGSVKNCKLLLCVDRNDDLETVQTVMGLKDINYRLWGGEVNHLNNIIYLVEEEHELNRILMVKLANLPDNAIFIL